MLEVPVEEDCEGGDLAHRLVRHRDIPVRQFEDFSRHLLRPHNNEKISIRPVDFLNNVRQSQSIGGQVDNFSTLVEKSPPNLPATSLIVASTVLSSLSAIMTPSAPSARAVRQTWVVTLESLKNRCPIRSTITRPMFGPGRFRLID